MKRAISISFVIGCLSLLFLTSLFLLTPYLADHFLIPRLLEKLPLTEKELSISRISPYHLRGTVTLAHNGNQFLSLPKFELHYSPKQLLTGKKVSKLILDSLSVKLLLTDGQIQLQGFTPSKQQKESKSSLPLLVPFGVETVVLRNTSITLQDEKKRSHKFLLDAQFDINLTKTDNSYQLKKLAGRIHSHGETPFIANLETTFQDTNNQKCSFNFTLPNLSKLRPLLPQLGQTQITGTLSGSAQLELEELTTLKNITSTAKLSGFRIWNTNFALENVSADTPIDFSINGNTDQLHTRVDNLLFSLPAIGIAGPVDLDGTLNPGDRSFAASATFLPQIAKSQIQLDLQGKTVDEKTAIHYQIQTNQIQLPNKVAIRPDSLQGDVEVYKDTFQVTLDSKLHSVSVDGQNLQLSDIAINARLRHPPENKKTHIANLIIPTIHYKGEKSGSLEATFIQQAGQLHFDSIFTTPFVPELKLHCAGTATAIDTVTTNCTIPPVAFHSDSFPPFITTPESLQADGQLAAAGQFSYATTGLHGTLDLTVTESNIHLGENSFEGINLALSFPDLPLIRSKPSQLCNIDRLKFGNISLSNALIKFRLEDFQTVFVEKSRLDWCKGKVETGSLTLSPDKELFETTLYCDRLDFAELLHQFGIEGTEGDGSLNGKLPIAIDKAGIRFEDGFLFSTPGNSGIVRFSNTKQLRQGMPTITQAAYLDYSMKSLENFTYNWAKLSFNNQDNDLVLKMQLDGKPAKPLPFGYKKGHIVPTEKGPGLQHPIRLDVNFRLPLQDLFQYGKNIQSIMENF